MTNEIMHLTKCTLFLSLLVLIGSCKKEEISEKQNSGSLNSFKMQVNGKSWEPTQVGEDKCLQTYNAAWSELTENGVRKPYYTILASRDEKALATSQSENGFRLRIFNVQKPVPILLLVLIQNPIIPLLSSLSESLMEPMLST